MMKTFWIGICALGFLLPAAAASAADMRPNILFLLADDQAPWALGAAGHRHAKTPSMDRLAREGAYLVNAFTTTPVCSPSRASLMTSRYGTELGITDWIRPGPEDNLGLDPKTVTWPEVLQAAGYKTGLVGKWHLGDKPQFHPQKTGFDYFMGFLGGGNSPVNPKLEKDGETRKFEGLTPDILTDHAIEFIRTNKADPFLLCVHYRAPHARWLPVADADWEPFEELNPTIPNPDYPKLDVERVKKMTREYLASVASVDRNVGRILQTLDEEKLADKTVVIYTSDHGYNMGHNGIWHKGNGHWVLTEPPAAEPNIPKGQRPNMYDNSIRVPTLVRWPGVVKPGLVVESTVGNLDWYPTLVAIAGAQLPPGEKIRGRDIGSVLRGSPPADWENDSYAEYSTHHQSHTHMRMYRTAQWKLIRDFLNPDRDELYDLVDDPAEQKNLIHSDLPEVTQAISELDAKIRQKMDQIGDKTKRPE
ncbi:sulfatase-like hydrolase/transferase [Lignipirellula cremea]|uniref:Arylsulfatase n=1 Tax=Lignipirellula cremea TaxID=2528010 RepID=A0A518DU02_9BACT|nr:sulfatase-like hydrolase/transferase [Lignipirellula cremea]QDU95317.1 Arylsulfatase [Lignipirellula cremea]